MEEVPEGSIDPRNAHAELVRYLRTSMNYVRRQGLTADEVVRIAQEHARPMVPTPVIPKPELLDKGINDMRTRMAN